MMSYSLMHLDTEAIAGVHLGMQSAGKRASTRMH